MRTKITFTTVPIHSFRILMDVYFSISSIFIRQLYRDSNPRLPQRNKSSTLKEAEQATGFYGKSLTSSRDKFIDTLVTLMREV